jgi:DNA-binding response OmpR family regulator
MPSTYCDAARRISSFSISRCLTSMGLRWQRPRVASRLELLREVWGYAEDVMSRTVDTHVAMLRRKLEHDPAHPRHIVTVRTFGYRIER